jgi:hypothetical protein
LGVWAGGGGARGFSVMSMTVILPSGSTMVRTDSAEVLCASSISSTVGRTVMPGDVGGEEADRGSGSGRMRVVVVVVVRGADAGGDGFSAGWILALPSSSTSSSSSSSSSSGL